jgi:hypothetical protein
VRGYPFTVSTRRKTFENLQKLQWGQRSSPIQVEAQHPIRHPELSVWSGGGHSVVKGTKLFRSRGLISHLEIKPNHNLTAKTYSESEMELSPCTGLVTGIEFAHSCQEFNANGPYFPKDHLNTDILDDGHCLDLCLSSISPRPIAANLRSYALIPGQRL